MESGYIGKYDLDWLH